MIYKTYVKFIGVSCIWTGTLAQIPVRSTSNECAKHFHARDTPAYLILLAVEIVLAFVLLNDERYGQYA